MSARKVMVSEELATAWTLRTEDGRRLSFVWGEPDADGFYSPLLTSTDDGGPDALALGLAWRRCEAALPEGWRVATVGQNYDGDEWHASAWDRATGAATTGRAPTPTAALEALAAKLESLP